MIPARAPNENGSIHIHVTPQYNLVVVRIVETLSSHKTISGNLSLNLMNTNINPTEGTMRKTSVFSCPYAVSIDDDDHSDNSTPELLELAKKCPAFDSGSCPFKGKDVREALVHIPASHLDKSTGYLTKALERLHSVQPNAATRSKFTLPGGCPMQPYFDEGTVSFSGALEDLSLSSILAKMSQDFFLHEEEKRDEEISLGLPAHILTQVAASSSPHNRSSSSLSQELKSGTAVSHQAAEDVHFVQNFIRGTIDRNLFADLTLSLYHVYQKLESLLEQHGPANFDTCHFPKELDRREALQEDVDFWVGNNTAALSRITPATQDYMDRLDLIASTNPLLLLAHAYTRYMGDLSGGKILSRVAKRAMNLSGGDGLAFYEFNHIESAKLFKDLYRQSLDDLTLTPAQISEIVAEANVAFVLNMRIFEELDVKANIPGAKVRSLTEALRIASTAASTKNVIPDECPFANINRNGGTAKAKSQRCPWPFVFAHDPVQGMQDWQTWVLIGLVLVWFWNTAKGAQATFV